MRIVLKRERSMGLVLRSKGDVSGVRIAIRRLEQEDPKRKNGLLADLPAWGAGSALPASASKAADEEGK
jgi:hypothetical protein